MQHPHTTTDRLDERDHRASERVFDNAAKHHDTEINRLELSRPKPTHPQQPRKRDLLTQQSAPLVPHHPAATMGIHQIANACAHLQNASRARLGLTSLPNHKSLLLFSLALHRSGLVSSVTRAGPYPPEPEKLLTSETEPVTTANVASRRLWLGLKYVNNEPVMWNVKSVSKPTRPITMHLGGLRRVARGFESGYVSGLKMGECLFVATDKGVLEIREALEKKVGGLMLCRISPY